jgi:hypothetical protein
MASSGMLRRVALERADFSEELSAFIIRVTKIGELRSWFTYYCHPYDGGAKFLRNVGSNKGHTA